MRSNPLKLKKKYTLEMIPRLSGMNRYLGVALESSASAAFEWIIPDNCLHLSDGRARTLNDPLLYTQGRRHLRARSSIIHEGDLQMIRERLHQALKGHGRRNWNDMDYRAELRLRDSVRGWRWVSISGRIVKRDITGRAVRMVGTLSDIDRRKQVENRIDLLHDLYAARSRTNQAIVRINDRDMLFNKICRIAVEHGRFNLAWIGVIDHASYVVAPCAAYGQTFDGFGALDITQGVYQPLQHHVIATAIRNGRPNICNDVLSAHNASTSNDSPPQYGSVASFPIFLDDRLFGVLNLYTLDAYFFNDQVVRLLTEMSQDISRAVTHYLHEAQRKSMEAALTNSEQFNSAILTAALDCIVSTNANGIIVSFNHAAEHTFGYKSTDVLGKNLAEVIIPPEWREQHQQGMERFLTTGVNFALNRRIELTAMRANGSTFPIELAVVPLQVRGERMFTAFIRDISDIKRSQAILKDSAMRYRQLVELSPEATFVYYDGKIALFNQAGSRMLGVRNPNDLLGRSIFDFVHPDYHALFYERARLQAHEAQPTPFIEQVWIRQDGSRFHTEIGATNLMYNDEPSVQVVVRDITERKRGEAVQAGQNQILNMVATGVSLQEILTAIARFVESQSGNGFCSILQLDPDGVTLKNRVAPSLPAGYLAKVGDAEVGPNHGSCGTAVHRGVPVIVTDIASDPLWKARRDAALEYGLRACASWPIYGKHRKILGAFALYFRSSTAPSERDLQLFEICTNLAGIAIESRASEEKIRYLAHYDGLTSLPNRFLFKEYLDLALRHARRHGNKFAVLFLDLDKFKEVNDTLGHDAGDLVLCEMARRLRNCLRHTDKIARMGGDEFYVLIEELDDSRYAADVAKKLLGAASRPIEVGDKAWHLSVSIGIAIYPEDGCDGQALLKNADNAMYRAKDMGKNAFQPFSSLETHNSEIVPPRTAMKGIQSVVLS